MVDVCPVSLLLGGKSDNATFRVRETVVRQVLCLALISPWSRRGVAGLGAMCVLTCRLLRVELALLQVAPECCRDWGGHKI